MAAHVSAYADNEDDESRNTRYDGTNRQSGDMEILFVILQDKHVQSADGTKLKLCQDTSLQTLQANVRQYDGISTL